MADPIHRALLLQLKTANGLPVVALENRDFKPTPGTPYVEEQYVPADRSVRTLLPGGLVETTGLYVVNWYGITNTGTDAIDTGVAAILAVFTPGLPLSLSGGGVVRIRTKPAPYHGQTTRVDGGWAVNTITIPWRVDAALS